MIILENSKSYPLIGKVRLFGPNFLEALREVQLKEIRKEDYI
jgi:hypothetical protein